MKKIHGEIMYKKKDGVNIHSDICPPDCNFENFDIKLRDFYHKCLDEWLDESNGTGIFYLKEEGFDPEKENYND